MRMLLIASLLMTLGISPCTAMPGETLASVPVPQDPSASSNSIEGLKKLIGELRTALRAKDPKAAEAYLNSLVIPDPASWFRATFGESEGERLAEDYAGGKEVASSVTSVLLHAASREMNHLEVVRFEESCDANAGEMQYPGLLLRKQQTPFYEVRLLGKASYVSLWFFAYVDAGFRYIGKVEVLHVGGRAFPKPPEQTKRIRIGGQVQLRNLLEQPRPKYPQRARDAGLQGTVKLHVLIGADGKVRAMQVLQGHCWLVEAALATVQKWRYQPTLLNGVPVEVVTTIDVVFTLSR